MRRKITKKTEQAVIKDYKNMISMKEISTRNNISQPTIYYILERNNVPNRKKNKTGKKNGNYKNISQKRQKEIIGYYLEPKSLKDVCKKFRIGHNVLNRILRENNIKRRELYGKERNDMISKKAKIQVNTDAWRARMKKLHVGAKRSKKTCELMSQKAHERMKKFKIIPISKIEQEIVDWLRSKHVDVEQQYRINDKGHPYDMYIGNKTIIEFNGPIHTDPNYFLHKDKEGSFEAQQERDRKHKERAEKYDYNLVILTYDDLIRKTKPQMKDDILHYIISCTGFELV